MKAAAMGEGQVAAQANLSLHATAGERHTSAEIPTDVWENVIDHLWNGTDNLKACTLVCQAWYPRSRFHLLRQVRLFSDVDAKACAKMLKQKPMLAEGVRDLFIVGGKSLNERLPIPHLSTMAMMLARKLPKLEHLEVYKADWQPWTMHKNVFLHLSSFSSVTHLTLSDVAFPSVTAFGQLVCAFSCLLRLKCETLQFTHGRFNNATFSAWGDRVKTRELHLDGSDSAKDVIDYFISTGMGANVQRFFILDNTQSWPATYENIHRLSFQRLIDCAATSLVEFQIFLAEEYTPQSTAERANGTLSCANNTALKKLLCAMPIPTPYELKWICDFLSTMHAAELQQLSLVVDIRGSEAYFSVQDMLSACGPAEFSQIDAVLSSDRFKSLRQVEFQLWATRWAESIPDAKQWELRLAVCFPQLIKRGILRATVMVDMSS